MRRITLVALAVFLSAAAAASCVASEVGQTAVNAAAVASGVAFNKESLKQAVAATQAVGLPATPTERQVPFRPVPAVQSPAQADKGVAQAPSACPPAIDPITLKQVLMPALESALKEIRAEMSGANKPPVNHPAPAPAVKAAPAPKPEAGVQVWPAVPASGRREPQPVNVAPQAPARPEPQAAGRQPGADGVAVQKPAEKTVPSQTAENPCVNCGRERVAPRPEPVQPVPPQAMKSAPGPATAVNNAAQASGVSAAVQQHTNVALPDGATKQVTNMIPAQRPMVPPSGANVQGQGASAHPGWGQAPAAAAPGGVPVQTDASR